MRRLIITGIALSLVPSLALAQQPTENFDDILRRLAAAESKLQSIERGSEFYTPVSFGDDGEGSDSKTTILGPPIDGDTKSIGDDLAKRLMELEENYSDLEKEHESLSKDYQLLDKDWSKFMDGETKKKSDAAKKPSFKIGGRIHMDYWSFPDADPGIGFFEHDDNMDANFGTDPEDFVAFRRIRLEMKGDVMDWGLWRVQIDFNNPSSAEIKDVYFGFKNLPNNQRLLIGHQKRPLGLDHLNSSRYNVFTERPMVVEAFNEDARRFGVAMYGNTDDELYHWQYGAYMLENLTRDGRYVGDPLQMSLNARLASSPWYDESSGGRGYYHWGIAAMAGHPNGTADGADGHSNEGRFRTRPEARSQSRWLNTGRIDGADWYYIGAVESILNVGPFQLTGEYQYNQMQRDSGFEDVSFHGGYLFASYFLTGEHIPYNRTSGTIGRVKPFENFFLVDKCDGGRGHGWGALAVAARYSYLDVSDEDVLGGYGQAATLALNWHWTAYSKVQLNLIRGSIEDHQAVGGQTEGDYTIFGARFAVEF